MLVGDTRHRYATSSVSGQAFLRIQAWGRPRGVGASPLWSHHAASIGWQSIGTDRPALAVVTH